MAQSTLRSALRMATFACILALSRLTLALPQPAEAPKPADVPVKMASYVIGLLRRGPNAPAPGTTSTPEMDKLQADHLAHIRSMWTAGKLVGAGPLTDDGDLRGILIFKEGSLDDVKALAEGDPKVKAGVLALELHPWLGPEGIGDKYSAMAKANPQMQDKMVTVYFALLKKGAARTPQAADAQRRLQSAHLANISRLIREGSMAAAGPFLDNGDLRGIFVLRAASLEEAKKLTDTDPAVQAGELAVDLHPWMVSEGVLP
jgi:uncharacterized protein YciI